jgi:hypothetical protein
MTKRRALGVVCTLMIASACGSTPSAPPTQGDAGGVGDAGRAGDPMRGLMVVTANSCATATLCHGADLGGSNTIPVPGTRVFPQNVTPDVQTGIGGWTDAQIEAAVRTGVDASGRTLCPTMPRFTTLTAQQMADLIAYLRSVPPVNREVPENSCR